MIKKARPVSPTGRDVSGAQKSAMTVTEGMPLCAQYNPELWFPAEKKPQAAKEAISICWQGCPRLRSCARQGLADRTPLAIFAGVQVGSPRWEEELSKISERGQAVLDEYGPLRRCAGPCGRPLRAYNHTGPTPPGSVGERSRGMCWACDDSPVKPEKKLAPLPMQFDFPLGDELEMLLGARR